MKHSELRQVIREEIQRLNEDNILDKLKNMFSKTKYKHLHKKYQNKAFNAFEKASKYKFSDPTRFPFEDEFAKLMDIARYYAMLSGYENVNHKFMERIKNKYNLSD